MWVCFQSLSSAMWLHPQCALPSGQAGIRAVVYPIVQFLSLCYAIRMRSLHVQLRGEPRISWYFMRSLSQVLPSPWSPWYLLFPRVPLFSPLIRELGLNDLTLLCFWQLHLHLGPSSGQIKREKFTQWQLILLWLQRVVALMWDPAATTTTGLAGAWDPREPRNKNNRNPQQGISLWASGIPFPIPWSRRKASCSVLTQCLLLHFGLSQAQAVHTGGKREANWLLTKQ